MKTIFWNVDTQYDFMRNDESFKGALSIYGARSIEGNLERLTRYARENEIQIVNTGDWHTKDSKELSNKPDFRTTFPPHCMIGTKGAEFVPATKPIDPYVIDWRDKNFQENKIKSREIILYKDLFGIFDGSPHANRVVELIKPNRAVVYGVATNVCVNFAVLGLRERGINVYVVRDAIKELPNLPLEEVLKNWQDRGAKLVTTEDVLEGKLQ